MTLEQEALSAVKQLKTMPFKATAIKLELEAHLNRRDTPNFEEVGDCHSWFMARFSELGLAEETNDFLEFSHGGNEFISYWHPIGALKYAEFYDDGSVDSEITLTISIKDPKNVLLLPKIIRIFSEFMEAVKEDGGDVSTEGAGMHIALLNSKNYVYPSNTSIDNRRRFHNFQRSMSMLLPALYFLGANSDKTRGLEYRYPRIEIYNGESSWDIRRAHKWSAICYSQGALEFRIFETCYESPNTILENIIVIKNCMKYWRRGYKPSGLETIANEVRFGIEYGKELSRFYRTVEHVDLLNAGISKLRPNSVKVRELKRKRNFSLTKRGLQAKVNEFKRDLLKQYEEYEERFAWDLNVRKMHFESQELKDLENTGVSLDEAKNRAKESAQAWSRRQRRRKVSLEKFIEQEIENFNSNMGEFTIGGFDVRHSL